MRRAAALLAAAAAAAVLLAGVRTPAVAGAAESAKASDTKTPIKHFIFLMQENHSFDNYFGTYPGADGHPAGVCMPRRVDDPSKGCVRPFWIGKQAAPDLDHSHVAHDAEYRNGAMDGFVQAFEDRGVEGDFSMGYCDSRDIPYYWELASEYVLFDRFFSAAAGGSVANHMFWIAGQSGGDHGSERVPPDGWTTIPTIFDRLRDEGVSWKFYVQNYDPSINYRNRALGDRGSQLVWVPLLGMPRFLDDPDLASHIVSLEEYHRDLQAGTLPSVAYIVPSGASEHPPGSIQAGQAFVKTLLTSLMRSDAWWDSAFMWSYDDWGGWYDHVPPPAVDEWGYGFRVPALLVSPYAKKGFVDSTELDFTSSLAFIEHNWGISPLAARDAAAQAPLDAFDFDAPPRAARLLGAQPLVVPKVNARVVYLTYVPLVALAGVFVLAVSRWRRRPALVPVRASGW